MLLITFLILYIIAGFLYVEPLWNSSENQKVLINLRAFNPLDDITSKLAFIKLMLTVFWPLMLVGSIGYAALVAMGFIGDEDAP